MCFSLVIPLWNEESNVPQLIESIFTSNLATCGMHELILVNNGSSDSTGLLIEEAKNLYPWIVTLHLKHNENYGGGVYEGIRLARTKLVCYIPGDLQVMPEDVLKVYNSYKNHRLYGNKLIIKGWRTIRHDSLQTRFVSTIYTKLSNLLLGLNVKDVNGLPKMFTSYLMDLIPEERMKSFVFDSQILAACRVNKWTLEEIPVTFHGRRSGVSSWSRKRIITYYQTIMQIYKLRNLRHKKGKMLERYKH